MTHPIVVCARGWTGTRFHHQGRLRKTAAHKGGVDCLGLLAGVAAELQLTGANGLPLAAADETDYSHYPDNVRLQEMLSHLLTAVLPEVIKPGDIILLRIDGIAQHMAIVSDYEGGLGMIHAYAPARSVVEHRLDGWWLACIEAAYRIQ